VRQSLVNAARQANATLVTIEVSATAAEFALRVIDNGNGLPRHPVESALANLRARAEALRGTSRAEASADGHGTYLVWRIPLATQPTSTDRVSSTTLPPSYR